MNCMLSMKRASHDAVMFSTGGRVSPESASEEKSPCHLAVTVLFFPSCLPGFSTSGVTEEKDSCLWTINPTLKHPLFLEFCIASVVIWHSVKKKEKKRKDKDKTKFVSQMPESLLTLHSLLVHEKRARTERKGEENAVNFSLSQFPLNSLVRMVRIPGVPILKICSAYSRGSESINQICMIVFNGNPVAR